jgi:hypothetical protein
MKTKEQKKEEIENAVLEFASEYPNTTLAMLTGLFVGLLEFTVEQQGGDPYQEIKIDGNGKRDITLHAPSTERSE